MLVILAWVEGRGKILSMGRILMLDLNIHSMHIHLNAALKPIRADPAETEMEKAPCM